MEHYSFGAVRYRIAHSDQLDMEQRLLGQLNEWRGVQFDQ